MGKGKKTMRVLLVEDTQSQVILIKKALERAARLNGCDYDTTTKANGVEALEYLEAELAGGGKLPHYILLDLFMPKMTGLEFLEVIKEIEVLKRIPIIMLTTSEDEVNEAYDAGISAYMVKPLGGGQLAQELGSIGHFMSSDFVRLPSETT